MATAKVTITLDEVDLNKIRSLVATRKAASVSDFVQHAVTIALHDVAGWGALLAEALEQTGGPMTPPERAWADGILAAAPAKRNAEQGGVSGSEQAVTT